MVIGYTINNSRNIKTMPHYEILSDFIPVQTLFNYIVKKNKGKRCCFKKLKRRVRTDKEGKLTI